MAIREIIEVPDPRLKLVSEPVKPEEFNDELSSWNQSWEKISRSIVSGAMPHPKQTRQPSQA